MPHEPSAYDKERIAHINHLMYNIHDSTAEIYESLIDRDFPTLKMEIKQLMSSLKDILDSTEDDIWVQSICYWATIIQFLKRQFHIRLKAY